ncbi:hypothetical protein Ocin01_12445, partial [Orchesella cincta]
AQYFYSSVVIYITLHFVRGSPYVPSAFITTRIFDLIIYFVAILVAIGLFIGSQKKIAALCWTWIGYTGIYGAITLVKFIVIIFGKCCDFGEDNNWYKEFIVLDLLWLVVELYFGCVVYAFIEQLGQEDSQKVNAELGDSTPAGDQVQPESSVIAEAQNPGVQFCALFTLIANIACVGFLIAEYHIIILNQDFTPKILFGPLEFLPPVKMPPNPCPCMKGMTLQWGVRAVAIIEAVVHSLIILANILGLVALELAAVKPVRGCKCKNIKTTPTLRPIIIVALTLFVINIPLAMLLFLGAHKKRALLCWIWIGCTAVSRVLIFISVTLIFSGIYGTFRRYFLIGALELVFITIEVYFLYVVFVFIRQLRQVGQQQINTGLDQSASTPGAGQPSDQLQLQPQPSASSATESKQPDPQTEVSTV